MSTHNLCFKQKYEKYQNFYLKSFIFLVVKFSIYLNRRVFVMRLCLHKVPSYAPLRDLRQLGVNVKRYTRYIFYHSRNITKTRLFKYIENLISKH